MRRPPTATALTALLLAAALVPASPAAAKQLVGLTVCGAAGCVDRSAAIGPQRPDGGLLDVGSTTVADPGRAPFVRVHLRIGDGSGRTFGHTTMLLLPGRGLARTEDGTWHLLPAGVASRLRRLARGVPRLPARALAPFEPAPAPPIPESPWRPPAVAAHAGAAGGPSTGLLAAAAGAAALLVAVVAGRLLRRRHVPTEASPTG